jgi:hypothetical protein
MARLTISSGLRIPNCTSRICLTGALEYANDMMGRS